MLTTTSLKSVIPNNKEISVWAERLNLILPKYQIDTKQRVATFVSQCAHESGGFTQLSENLNYSDLALKKVFGKYFPNQVIAAAYARRPEKIANRVYASRMGNGPEASGDGWKYRGRGIMQLTGKNNYIAASKYLYNSDILVVNPDLVATDKNVIIETACWYWKVNNLNKWADIGDVDGVSDVINIGRKTATIGDAHGYADRKAKYDKLISLL